jgi:hypothetical protein
MTDQSYYLSGYSKYGLLFSDSIITFWTLIVGSVDIIPLLENIYILDNINDCITIKYKNFKYTGLPEECYKYIKSQIYPYIPNVD